MISRELVVSALNHTAIPHIPRLVDYRQVLSEHEPLDIEEIQLRYPSDIQMLEMPYDIDSLLGVSLEDGPPLKQLSLAKRLEPALEVLEKADRSKIESFCESQLCFTLAPTLARPFELWSTLRGPDSASHDLTHDEPAAMELLDRLHDAHLAEMEFWGDTSVDGVLLGDDLGTPFDPTCDLKVWREVITPMLADYCDMLHAQDKFVFFQGTSATEEVFDDLVEIGVDAIGAPFTLSSIASLAKRYRGQVAFWYEPPRELSYQQKHSTIFEVRRLLDFGHGGLLAQCPWTAEMSRNEIASLMDQWCVALPMHA